VVIDHFFARISSRNGGHGKEPMSMPDLDPASDLQQRLARIEASLVHIRLGKPPTEPVDLMAWRADTSTPPSTAPYAGWRLEAILRCLREDWHGLTEAIRNWGLRVEERFSR
jgi:hypothetical protein